MSFTGEIKSEISYNELRDCCAKAELSALIQLTSSLRINKQGLFISSRSENPTTARRIMLLLKKVFAVTTQLNVFQKSNLKKNNVYEIEVQEDAFALLSDLGIHSEKGLATYPRYEIVRKDCCARAYIAGCFLAYGSCNDPDKPHYHLELALQDEFSAAFIIRQLRRFSIEAKATKRRNKHIVYLKKAESISDFLRCIGAQESFMNFENSRISRDYINSRIRIDNCDIANFQKSMNAAKAQLAAISKIEQAGRWEELPEKSKIIANLRKSYPEHSLSDLCKEFERIYHERISRSGIKHRMDKVMNLAEKY